MYQTVETPKEMMDRKDHVWAAVGPLVWKCYLCGAITADPPPMYPTNKDWMPSEYERLTPAQRNTLPYKG